MKKYYSEPERKIRPYKTTCRKSETEEDERDMFRLAGENINGNCKRKQPIVLANNIENAEDILDEPDRIADQFIRQQDEILNGEICRSRRVNVMTFHIDEKKYDVNLEDGIALAQGIMNEYKEYSSIAAVTENKNTLRIDFIVNNFCDGGLRLTQVFNPNTMYNQYKEMKEQKRQ